MIVGIILYGIAKKINVYDYFVEGAKEGVSSAVKIIAPLVGLMVAISVFRASGALALLTSALRPFTNLLRLPSDVVPLAILRPITGSGSLAVLNDIFKQSGPDSISGKIASVMMGSTETTIYTIAVYFGAVGISRSRHTLSAALLADLAGIVAATVLTYAMLT